MVADVAELLLAIPFNRSKFAKNVISIYEASWEKFFMSRRMNNDKVKVVVNGVTLHDTTFIPITPDPFNKLPYLLAKMGKAVEGVAATRIFPQAESINSLDLNIEFFLASSMSNPFRASVMGSWSNLGVSTPTVSIMPDEFTLVAVDARVNVIRGSRTPSLININGVDINTGGVLETITDSFADPPTAIAHP
jgi:hypothetical protein